MPNWRANWLVLLGFGAIARRRATPIIAQPRARCTAGGGGQNIPFLTANFFSRQEAPKYGRQGSLGELEQQCGTSTHDMRAEVLYARPEIRIGYVLRVYRSRNAPSKSAGVRSRSSLSICKAQTRSRVVADRIAHQHAGGRGDGRRAAPELAAGFRLRYAPAELRCCGLASGTDLAKLPRTPVWGPTVAPFRIQLPWIWGAK